MAGESGNPWMKIIGLLEACATIRRQRISEYILHNAARLYVDCGWCDLGIFAYITGISPVAMNHTQFIATSAPFAVEENFQVDVVTSLVLGFVVGCIGIYSCVRNASGYRPMPQVRCQGGSRRSRAAPQSP
jgi:hypothetical protein